MRVLRILALGLACLLAGTRVGAEGPTESPVQPSTQVDAVVALMGELRGESRRHAERIRAVYGPAATRLTLANRRALRAALDRGRIVPVPLDYSSPQVPLRLTGRHPIAELDLSHQSLYVAARPQTIGCLLDVVSRLPEGAVEVTSLVRHRQYQLGLARTNANANTPVATHAMGLAFDLSVRYAAPSTVEEVRGVLRRMASAGDLLFIAEQRQLVFHVVPAPERREYYEALYYALSAGPRIPLTSVPRAVSRSVERLHRPFRHEATQRSWPPGVSSSQVQVHGCGHALRHTAARPPPPYRESHEARTERSEQRSASVARRDSADAPQSCQ
jgi:hypothetical protein